MNLSAPNPQTRTTSTTQEVLVRTLASDAASLEHGAQTPAPLQMTTSLQPVSEEGDRTPKQHGWVRIAIAILVLAALAFLGYQYVYPQLIGPTVIQ